jgi:hypothetical protein
MEVRLQKWLRKLPRRYKKYRQPEGLWSMTIPYELAFCESFARECFSGRGRMVDLGCWYGATTLSLARGLKRNWRARNNRLIEGFDLFVWNKWMDPVADHIKMPKMYRERESFFHDVQKLLQPYKRAVRLYQQDLMDYKPVQSPVELLFVDAMKSWALAKKIVTEFFPLLIPGVSVVVQQDFVFHDPIAATSHLLMWRLRHYFEWLHQIPRSGSVVFLCKKQIDATALPRLEPESFSLEEIDQAYEYSRACVVEDDRRTHVEATKLFFLIERGHYDAALKHARWLVESGIKFRDYVVADAQTRVAETRTALVRRDRAAGAPGMNTQAKQLAEIAALLPDLQTSEHSSARTLET